MNTEEKILDLFRRNSADADFFDPKEAVVALTRVRGLIHERVLSDQWEIVQMFGDDTEDVLATAETKEAADYVVNHSPNPSMMLARRVVRILVDYED